MPAPNLSRHSRTPTINTTATPAKPKATRTLSPTTTNTSYSPTLTPGGQQRLNVVTRVAIEGRAKQGQDGASVKMYLKISLPLDTVTPGTTIPLFPEENVKILTSQVHPLDNASVPYNFSSTISPLLHSAARALNLPARSSETYNSVFHLYSSPASSSVASSARFAHSTINGHSLPSENIPPIDGQYTGHILVSGYNISYVLPKAFPSRNKSDALPTENEIEGFTKSSLRRPSLGERNTAQFMAAIDMWVPYISRPPRSPYLLSIPTPRCLHNNIKLRIFPPTTTSSSFASLSSIEEDGSSWDLTSDPHVTRSASNRPSRRNSYTHFADDESSDSSTAGFSDGCGIQGTFPSAERIRVRWAKPLKTIDAGGDDGSERRRVGVKDVKGEMSCIIRGKGKGKDQNSEGLLMDVEYTGTCKGIWFPGVATLLGMDVGLETKGSDVSWVDGSPREWVVQGGAGYTGFDVGTGPRQTDSASRTSSVDSNSPHVMISHTIPTRAPIPAVRMDSTSSTASLLRAPLPAQNVAEYSFEGSTATLASSSQMGTISSMSSLTPGSRNGPLDPPPRPPGVPITLHINMNELIFPAKNTFTFTISGTIIITARSPRPGGSNTILNEENHIDYDPEPIILPRFTVLAADSEVTSIVVRNEVDGLLATVEVFNSSGDIYRDAQARKTVLQKGGSTKCAENGGRIALKAIGPTHSGNRLNRPRTPNGNALPQIPSNSSLGRMVYPSRPKRDGPLMITSVLATITPLTHKDDVPPEKYAVRVCLNAPADTDSEWLEFGLAQPKSAGSPDDRRPLRVVIVSASVEGVPVKFETTAAAKPETTGLGVPFEKLNSQEWVSWVKVHIGPLGGGAVAIEYVVTQGRDEAQSKGKAKFKDKELLHIFLPTFSLPTGILDVQIDIPPTMEVLSLYSNFKYQLPNTGGRRLLEYSLEEFFNPHLSVAFRPVPSTKKYPQSTLLIAILMTWVMSIAGCIYTYHLCFSLKQITENYSVAARPGWNYMPEPVTVITTIYTNTGVWSNDVLTTTRPMPSPLASTVQTASAISPSPDGAQLPDGTVSSHTSLPRDVGTPPIPAPPPASSEKYALRPVQHMVLFSWPVEDWDLHATLDKVFETVETLWQIFRKAYHYPLDPP